jgi:putative Ca2+/H+ antiporter (TMEM165/GDT1 family)
VDWLIAAATAFGTIAVLELPDKTFVATLVLSTRYRALAVWLGVVSAFALHTLLAVAAGSLVSLLPETPVRLVAAGLFAVGAVVMLRTARRADVEEQEQEQEYAGKVTVARRGFAAYGASFLLLATAEWGDLSQLFTAGLVASGEPPVAVFVGAFAALAAVSGAAVLLGRWLLRRVRLSIVRYVAAGVCAVLAVVTVWSALA